MQPALGQTGLDLILSPAETSRPQSLLSSVCRRNGISDQRLSSTYNGLQGRIDPAQREPLLTTQQLWVQYRDANCGFYERRKGQPGQVQAAECIRSMTEDRAGELEKGMKFD